MKTFCLLTAVVIAFAAPAVALNVSCNMPSEQQARMVRVDRSIDVNNKGIKCETPIIRIASKNAAQLLPTALAFVELFDKSLVPAQPFSKIDKSQFSAARKGTP